MSAENPVRCAVLGAGSFGTCLSILLAEKGYSVDLWARDARLVEAIRRDRRNPRYLSDFVLPNAVRATTSLEEALYEKELIVSVVPSHAVREIWEKGRDLVRPDALIVSASKGIEMGTGKLVSDILMEILPREMHDRLCFLSGPSFAREIAERRPTAVSLAARNENYAIAAQTLISSPLFRCYTTSDVVGVELGGALKNVIAIAIGVADGMEAGLNSRAALITRGLAEITRLGVALGANPVTFLGLSGVGDLVLTCTGDLSRNRRVGLEIGRGKTVDEVLAGLTQVAEGVRTAKSAYELALKLAVDMPISTGVYLMLFEGKDPTKAGVELRSRQLKSEYE
ncbi:MAG: NAD(P)H-dependent glycerol-3-phosphate dehydrogenase [bacterium]